MQSLAFALQTPSGRPESCFDLAEWLKTVLLCELASQFGGNPTLDHLEAAARLERFWRTLSDHSALSEVTLESSARATTDLIACPSHATLLVSLCHDLGSHHHLHLMAVDPATNGTP